MLNHRLAPICVASAVAVLFAQNTLADTRTSASSATTIAAPTLLLTPQAQERDAADEEPANEPREIESLWGYRGISAFFNIREAYSNVEQGEWEIEFAFEWETESGEEDGLELEKSIKYGFTDQFHIELEVQHPNLGDGGKSGAGELQLTLFYNMLEEDDAMPALGAFLKARIPSGSGSSGVDGTFSLIATKSLTDSARIHFQSFVMTANGGVGADGDEGRRDFQWGFGPGFDFLLDDHTVLAVNYLHRANGENGNPNQNILEFGVVHKLGELFGAEQTVKFAVDVGLDGHDSTPNAGAKLLWSIEWK